MNDEEEGQEDEVKKKEVEKKIVYPLVPKLTLKKTVKVDKINTNLLFGVKF